MWWEIYVHSGIIATELTVGHEGQASRGLDSPTLCASTILYLISGRADYLNGRFVTSTWDSGEVERDWKEKIIAQDALISKLSKLRVESHGSRATPAQLLKTVYRFCAQTYMKLDITRILRLLEMRQVQEDQVAQC